MNKKLLKKNGYTIFVSESSVDTKTDEKVMSFWEEYENNFEDYTFKIFDRFLNKDYGFIDVGAWIGATVLYGANISKTCYCFEPDRVAFKYLENNIAVNEEIKDRIHSFDFGVSNKNSKEVFYVGSGSTSMSSLKPIWDKRGSYEIDVCDFPTTLQRASIDLSTINFIKIDIEGGEFDLIPSLIDYLKKVNHYPTLYISLHTPFTFSMMWKKTLFHKVVAYLPKKISARMKNKKLIEKVLSVYSNVYLRDGKKLTSIAELGDARAFTEIVVTNEVW